MPETIDREQLAARAAAELARRGPPDARREDWRYVKLKEALALEPAPSRRELAQAVVEAVPHPGIVLVDGDPVADGGVALRHEMDADDLRLLGEAIDDGEHADLQTAGEHVTFLGLDLSGVREEPLQIVHYLTGGEPRLRIHLRARAGSVTDLCLQTVHLGRARADLGISIEVEAGAMLRIDELDTGAGEAIGANLVSKRARLAQDAHLRITTALQGGVLQRHAARVELMAPGCEASLGGATVATGNGQAHHVIRLYHRAGGARSRQAFKAIADGRGLAGFDGLIHVDPGADETDALQQSNNLQLSPTARIATRPQLDIFTDEVVASHGATIGQPDEEELRYLRSRGLDAASATALIVEGFLREGLEGMGPLRAEAETALIDLIHQRAGRTAG